MIHLYEAELPENNMKEIAALPINEGRRGVLVPRRKWSASLFPEHLAPVIKEYESLWRPS